MAKKPNADETPASETTPETAAPAVAAEQHTVVAGAKPSTASKWILTSIAGVGLLALGLLGGVLIGQHSGHPSAQDRGPGAHITIEHQQSNPREQLKERIRERIQDVREGRQGPGQNTPAPSDSGE